VGENGCCPAPQGRTEAQALVAYALRRRRQRLALRKPAPAAEHPVPQCPCPAAADPNPCGTRRRIVPRSRHPSAQSASCPRALRCDGGRQCQPETGMLNLQRQRFGTDLPANASGRVQTQLPMEHRQQICQTTMGEFPDFRRQGPSCNGGGRETSGPARTVWVAARSCRITAWAVSSNWRAVQSRVAAMGRIRSSCSCSSSTGHQPWGVSTG